MKCKPSFLTYSFLLCLVIVLCFLVLLKQLTMVVEALDYDISGLGLG